MTRLVRPLVALVTVLAVLIPAGAASAAGTTKIAVLTRWTQTSGSAFDAWNAARRHQPAWVRYGFDWSTDYCSDSPDRPLGFDFRLPCWHHDFGYRNWKAAGQFRANKDRLDQMFYADLKRTCAAYVSAVRAVCNSLAWTYYQAVHYFGSVSAVSPADLQRAAALAR
jgi:Prokaryotic phospholipase A2